MGQIGQFHTKLSAIKTRLSNLFTTIVPHLGDLSPFLSGFESLPPLTKGYRDGTTLSHCTVAYVYLGANYET